MEEGFCHCCPSQAVGGCVLDFEVREENSPKGTYFNFLQISFKNIKVL